MGEYDDRFPEDLRDIAARLSAARETPSPLELDELHQRVHARARGGRRSTQRRGLAGTLRTNFVAVALTLGLMSTSGVGVVLASGSFGGSGPDRIGRVWFDTHFDHRPPPFASFCQYFGKKTSTYTWHTKHSILTVILFFDCRFLHFHIICGVPFGYKFGGGPWYDTKLTSYDGTAPINSAGLTITADGSTYSFNANGTPSVQGTPNPSFSVAFNANGGTGSMASETHNAPTALTPDGFTRAGYTFTGWNTAANGAGTAYASGATFPFTANATLYAQWKANPSFTVAFNANGGTGGMASEAHNVPAPLTSESFTRSGYTFAGWNTAANGSGTAYANSATYAFTANATLYAQWTATRHH
jgi:uncharacterized repeat protein (TIGR02543 family)